VKPENSFTKQAPRLRESLTVAWDGYGNRGKVVRSALDSYRRGALFKVEEIQAAVEIEGIKSGCPTGTALRLSGAGNQQRERPLTFGLAKEPN
jgi:hypothetical protein